MRYIVGLLDHPNTEYTFPRPPCIALAFPRTCKHLKVLLPKPKPHQIVVRPFTRRLDLPRRSRGPTEIHPHRGSHLRTQLVLPDIHIALVHQPIPHGAEQALEVRPAVLRFRAQFREWIETVADGVEVDIRRGIRVDLLREVGVDAQKLGPAVCFGGARRLGFEAAEQGLEPLEGFNGAGDPDELDALETFGRVGARADVVDVFEHGGPGGDADAGADEDGDLVVEDVFGRRAVGAVDAQGGHGLVVLQGDFVDAVVVVLPEVAGLGGAAAEAVAEGAGEVADLSDVDGDVGVEGAGGDGEGVPLL